MTTSVCVLHIALIIINNSEYLIWSDQFIWRCTQIWQLWRMVILKKRRIYSCLAMVIIICIPLYHLSKPAVEKSSTVSTSSTVRSTMKRNLRRDMRDAMRSRRERFDRSLTGGKKIDWCKQLKYRRDPAGIITALVSFPGSGNTWVRYLLQQVSGLYTGSIYSDGVLMASGFAEFIQNHKVLVVKTHEWGEVSRWETDIKTVFRTDFKYRISPSFLCYKWDISEAVFAISCSCSLI